MTWEEMTPKQRDALVAEKVMGWKWILFNYYDVGMEDQLWLLPDAMSTHNITPGEWTWYVEEPEVYPEGSVFPLPHKDNHILPRWIPHYTTSMDAAWQVMQQMGARFNPKDMYAYEPFIPFTNELFGTENEELYPSYRYMGEQIAKWTPARICLAALRAVGYEDL